MPEEGPNPTRRTALLRMRWALVGLLLVCLVSAGALGMAYLDRLDRAAQAEARNLLRAVADLKVRQIVHWRKERLADANLVRTTPYVTRRALDLLAEPMGAARWTLVSWLRPLMEGGVYQQVLLVDTNLSAQLVLPTNTTAVLDGPVHSAVEKALRVHEVVGIDFYRPSGANCVRVGWAVPLVVRREGRADRAPAAGAPPSDRDRAAAVLVLLSDAGEFLFPLLKTWPTPSLTAETLLVRREGADWLALTDARHQAGAAFSLRLGDRQVPPPGQDIVGARDYRSTPVLAVAEVVPRTPWHLLAKVDCQEVYEPVRQQARMVWSGLVLLALTATLGVALLWRRQEAHALRERLRSERERLAQATRVHYLMKNAHDIILLADHELRIIEANDRAVESLGYSLDELLQMRLPQLRAPGEPSKSTGLGEDIEGDGATVFETLHARRDGSTFAVEGTTRRVQIDQEDYYLSILRDVTERKRLESELHTAQKLESVGQLAGGVAHHFNNILAAMILQLTLLRLNQRLDRETSEGLREIESGAQRAADLIRALLTFSRRRALELKTLDFNNVISSSLARLQSVAGPSVDMRFEPGDELEPVAGDSGMLHQVLVNLTANARDAMPDGGRLTLATAMVDIPEAEVRPDVDQRPGRFVCLKVTDTGSGMDQATLQHVFEPFFTTKEVGQGTGMGLATVYGIAVLHGGWVTVESQLGRGTSFRVFIPTSTGAAEAAPR